MSSVASVPAPGDPAPGDPTPYGGPVHVADWGALRSAADRAATHAYAPYSRLRVGAAGLCQDGTVVTGCNVENASFGLTLCAECGLVSSSVGGGHGRLLAVSVTAGDGHPLAPCGRCRQLLMEHGGPSLLVDGGPTAKPRRLDELLPEAFTATDVAVRGATWQPGPPARPGGAPK